MDLLTPQLSYHPLRAFDPTSLLHEGGASLSPQAPSRPGFGMFPTFTVKKRVLFIRVEMGKAETRQLEKDLKVVNKTLPQAFQKDGNL